MGSTTVAAGGANRMSPARTVHPAGKEFAADGRLAALLSRRSLSEVQWWRRQTLNPCFPALSESLFGSIPTTEIARIDDEVITTEDVIRTLKLTGQFGALLDQIVRACWRCLRPGATASSLSPETPTATSALGAKGAGKPEPQAHRWRLALLTRAATVRRQPASVRFRAHSV